jgi:hypothetical protein
VTVLDRLSLAHSRWQDAIDGNYAAEVGPGEIATAPDPKEHLWSPTDTDPRTGTASTYVATLLAVGQRQLAKATVLIGVRWSTSVSVAAVIACFEGHHS